MNLKRLRSRSTVYETATRHRERGMDAELAETLRHGCRMSTGTKAMKVITAVSAKPSETESACSGLYA